MLRPGGRRRRRWGSGSWPAWLCGWALVCCQREAGAAGPPCREADYHFEYTECDSSGSRWRVAVPNLEVACSGLPDPIKGKECTFSCASGEYLEMKNQVCTKCPEGTFSVGSGIQFVEWDDLPAGFTNVATYMDSVDGSSENKAESCSKSSWNPRGNYIESNRDDCTVALIYTVLLKKSGFVTFEYQYIDKNIIFEFFVRASLCTELKKPYLEKCSISMPCFFPPTRLVKLQIFLIQNQTRIRFR